MISDNNKNIHFYDEKRTKEREREEKRKEKK